MKLEDFRSKQGLRIVLALAFLAQARAEADDVSQPSHPSRWKFPNFLSASPTANRPASGNSTNKVSVSESTNTVSKTKSAQSETVSAASDEAKTIKGAGSYDLKGDGLLIGNIGMMSAQPFPGSVSGETLVLAELLRDRIGTPDNPRPIEFRGKSTAGHEFTLVVQPSAIDILGPVVPDKDGHDFAQIDVEFRFDGSDLPPLRATLAPSLGGPAQSLTFFGLAPASTEPGALIRRNSQTTIVVVINFDEMYTRFQLRHFAIHPGGRPTPSLPQTDDTIVYGGLDSGGGGK
jgi:hypothetical protein